MRGDRPSPRARKRFGQHFLVDRGAIGRIAELCHPAPDELLLEVGPGRGALTRQLLAHGHYVAAVELDRDLAALLSRQLRDEQLRLIQGDVLRLDFRQLLEEEGRDRLIVVGNLPYNISAPFLFRLLDNANLISRAVVMLQREVANRITAAPGSREYGLLSVLLGMLADATVCLEIGSGAFRPRPKVNSSVVELRFRNRPRCALRYPAAFQSVVRAAFAQRRKMLRNALQGLWNGMAPPTLPNSDWPTLERAAAAAGIDLSRRAETLAVEEFALLSDAMAAAAEAVGRVTCAAPSISAGGAAMAEAGRDSRAAPRQSDEGT